MNKLTVLRTSLVALFIFAISTITFSQSYLIKMRLNEGDTFVHNIKMSLTVTVMETMKTTINMDMGSLFKVVSAAPNFKDLQMTYTKMSSSTNVNGEIASNKSDSLLKSIYSKMIGKPVTLKLSADNQITDVVGVDNLWLNFDSSENFKQVMTKMFSKDHVNSLFSTMFSMYPKDKVKIGDSWTTNSTVNVNGLDMNVNLKYTLTQVKDGLAVISMDAALNGKGEIKNKGMSFPMEMGGTEKGVLSITIATGYMHSGDYTMDITGNVEANGQKVPMTMHGDYSLNGN